MAQSGEFLCCPWFILRVAMQDWVAELDVAKRRKVPRDNTSWIDVVPHGNEYVAPRMWKFAKGRQPLP